jgi:hypothetical protein
MVVALASRRLQAVEGAKQSGAPDGEATLRGGDLVYVG